MGGQQTLTAPPPPLRHLAEEKMVLSPPQALGSRSERILVRCKISAGTDKHFVLEIGVILREPIETEV